ncbi:MAG: chromate efflux transporter [Deltaproteobacteria bacterium]|nr:MAG: chromate efflux transporter [Deltaproteobacteria bacterium]
MILSKESVPERDFFTEKEGAGNPMNTPSVWEITRTFLHLGATAYGGLAMVEPIRFRVVQEKGWLQQKDFLDGLALCQLVPGATVVQLATYVGFRLRRGRGGLAAAGAFILPAFLLMLGLSLLYFRYGDLAWVKAVSRGFSAVVIALLVQALWRLTPIIRRHWIDLVIALLALAALWIRVNYLLVFLAAGCLRLVLGLRFACEERLGTVAPTGPAPDLGLIITQITGTVTALTLGVWGLWNLNHNLGLMSWIFLKISVVAFGGGYAMIPILQWDMVDHLGWLTLRQFLDGILLGFVTPGPIIITATFVGYWLKGLLGAAVATVSIFLPPILMIIFLTPFYQRIKEGWWVRPMIQGILAALMGMLVLVTVQMGLAALIDLKCLAMMVVASTALIVFRVNLLWIVAAAACLSILLF